MQKAEAIRSIEEFITDSQGALEYETHPVRIAEIEINIKEARRQVDALYAAQDAEFKRCTDALEGRISGV